MPLVESIAAKRPAVRRAVGLKLITAPIMTIIMVTTMMMVMTRMKTFCCGQ